jgi:hypothetical protein
MKHPRFGLLSLAAALILAQPAAVLAQDEPLYSVSNKQLQKILTDLKFKHKTDNMGNLLWEIGNHPVTLQSFYDGKAIVIGINLPDYKGITLEKINKWNDDEALSRAILRFVKTKEGNVETFPRLEADLNAELGVTPKTIDLFIKQFNKSVEKFKKTLKPKVDVRGDRRTAVTYQRVARPESSAGVLNLSSMLGRATQPIARRP